MRLGFVIGDITLRRVAKRVEGAIMMAEPLSGGAPLPALADRAASLLAGHLGECFCLAVGQGPKRLLDRDHRGVRALIEQINGSRRSAPGGGDLWSQVTPLRQRAAMVLSRHTHAVLHVGDELVRRLGRKRVARISGEEASAILAPYLDPYIENSRLRYVNRARDSARYRKAHGTWLDMPVGRTWEHQRHRMLIVASEFSFGTMVM
ncbi:MAG: hypothetical protein NT062_36910 [Proteobacteria bacterium]|nr:hypothetical protein [Pseudomonadota bacterium]